jgi:osmotically-inducible protein OsmY
MEHPTERLLAVADHARSRLLRNPYLALRNVSCDYREGVLTLRGCLPSYHLKQVAQTAVASLDGVAQVVNEIEVLAAR